MLPRSALSSNSFSADRFQLLLEHSSDAIAEFDADLRYTAVNVVWASWFDLEPESLLGTTNAELSERWASFDAKYQFCWSLQQGIQHVAAIGGSFRTPHHLSTALIEIAYTAIANEAGSTSQVFAIGRILKAAPLSEAAPPPAAPSALNLQSDVSLDEPAASNLAEFLDPRYQMPASLSSRALISRHLLPDAIIGAEMPGLDEISLPYEPNSNMESIQRLPSVRSHAPTAQERQQAAQMLGDVGFLQLVLDSIPQYIFWKDRNSRYLGCNRLWAEMAGLNDPEEVVGLTDADLPWTREQREWYLTCDRQVMETGVPMLGIKQSQRQADGRVTWRETSKIPIRDTHGTIIGLLGTIEDVTERKQAEDLLKHSEAKYKKLAQREELLNRLSNQIRNSLDLEEILQTVVLEVRQLLDTDRVVIYQFDSDWHGQVIIENVMPPWASILGETGADSCFPEQMADLCEQGRVRAIDDVSNSGLDACHIEFLQRLQVRSNLMVPILIDQRLWGLLIAHACQSTRQWKQTEIELLQYLAGQIGVAIRQAQLYAQATANAEESRVQALKLKQTLRELQQAQTQLIQTEKMSSLGQLVAGVAHEINNPVNFIYGNLTYIEDYTQGLVNLVRRYQLEHPSPSEDLRSLRDQLDLDFLIEDIAKILQSLRIGSERIRKIVLSLRNFSRLDESEMKYVDLHEGIDNTLLILQHRLKASPTRAAIHLIKHYGELPLTECYPSQLNQVFMNVLSNAIDALEELGPGPDVDSTQMRITITTEAIAPANLVRICIHNNGPAIPAALQSRLFDPFFTTKPIGQGTGLGLSISHQIMVQKHHGNLTCTSAPGQGVEFCLELPITHSQPSLPSSVAQD